MKRESELNLSQIRSHDVQMEYKMIRSRVVVPAMSAKRK